MCFDGMFYGGVGFVIISDCDCDCGFDIFCG